MNILITGATGFIGSKLAEVADTSGHKVAAMALPTEKLPASLSPRKEITWIRGTLDRVSWEQIAAFEPQVCVHTAWITTPGVYLESPENERFRDDSLNFLRSARKHGVEHIVALGTCIEYLIGGKEPLSENRTPIAPTTTYSRCKDELRRALESEARTHNSQFCWARIFYPYGPGEHPSRLCTSVYEKLTRGETLALKTPASTKDYIYIDDIAAALLCLVEARATGPVNVGTGIGTTVFDLARNLGELIGKPELVVRAVPELEDPLGYVVADSTRLRGLGWQPQTDVAAGLKKLVEALQARPRA